MQNNQAAKTALTWNNKTNKITKKRTLNRERIPYQAGKINVTTRNKEVLVRKKTCITTNKIKTLPAGCFFVGDLANRDKHA